MITNSHYKFRAERALYSDSIELTLGVMHPSGRMSLATSITFEEHDPGSVRGHPTLKITTEEAQRLMDELWSVGLRPAEGKGSAGQLEAVNRHLEDMRRLVFQPPGGEITVHTGPRQDILR